MFMILIEFPPNESDSTFGFVLIYQVLNVVTSTICLVPVSMENVCGSRLLFFTTKQFSV